MRSCNDGYPGCRHAEATGKWCAGSCRTELQKELAALLEKRDQVRAKQMERMHSGGMTRARTTTSNAAADRLKVLATEPAERVAAIVDFTFNLGAGRLQTSTLRRRINQREWSATERELRRWVYGGGRVLPGLVIRREAEAALMRMLPR